MTIFRATLQFTAAGPAVTGEWSAGPTARRTWRDWIGLYGSGEDVIIRLVEDANDGERVLAEWKHGRVVVERR
ncbi:hypothetical protein [Streptomyces sp. NPDC101150]|uniref:hypothetical protein n=1 Tax=Streptomyces sp. NPDC101150 TaxID=3366114 RepID=UPI0038220352